MVFVLPKVIVVVVDLGHVRYLVFGVEDAQDAVVCLGAHGIAQCTQPFGILLCAYGRLATDLNFL